MTGAFTATEAGGIAVVYAMVLGFFAFRNLTIGGSGNSLMITGRADRLFCRVLVVSECLLRPDPRRRRRVDRARSAGASPASPILFMLASPPFFCSAVSSTPGRRCFCSFPC